MRSIAGFHAAARAEFIDAAAWYEAQRPGLGAEFIEEIDRCVQRAAVDPQSHPRIHRDLRRVVARRFPYCVYFRAEGEAIIVMAVFHASRDPMVWTHRD